MIATCGHEIKEGIMATVDEGQTVYDGFGDMVPAVSYGSYCPKCIMEHYENGTLLNEELKDLIDSIHNAYEDKWIAKTWGR